MSRKVSLRAQVEELEEKLKRAEEDRRNEVNQQKGWLEEARQTISNLRAEVVQLESAVQVHEELNGKLTSDLSRAQGYISSLGLEIDEREREEGTLLRTMQVLLLKLQRAQRT